MKPQPPTAAERSQAFEKFFHARNLLLSHEFAPPVVVQQDLHAKTHTTMPVQQVIGMVIERINVEIAEPILTASDDAKLGELLPTKVPLFEELLTTLSRLRAFVSSPAQVREQATHDVDETINALCSAAVVFAGEDAGRSTHFAANAYASAIRVAVRLDEAGPPKQPDSAAKWHELHERWRVSVAFHQLGAWLIFSLGRGATGTPAACTFAMEALREGALDAYAAAREAETLVVPEKSGDGDLPFDDEDAALSEAD